MNLQSIASNHPKLSTEEERELLLKVKKGTNEEERQEAKTKLLFLHAALILSIVQNFNNVIRDNIYLRQDAESAGVEGFLRALNSFDLKYTNRINTYAYYRIYLEVWDSLINNTIAHFIPKHIYKEIYRFISSHKEAKEDEILNYISSKIKVDENTALIIFNIIRDGGIQNLSELEEFREEFNEGSGSENFTDGLKSVLGSSSDMDSGPIHVELALVAADLEDYSKNNLTIPQQRVINAMVLPYLRERRIVTKLEAAEQLMVAYQAVDQSLQYIQMKMISSTRGRKLSWVISKVIEQTKGHRRSRGRKLR